MGKPMVVFCGTRVTSVLSSFLGIDQYSLYHCIKIEPDCGSQILQIFFNRVDLPEPFGPMMP